MWLYRMLIMLPTGGMSILATGEAYGLISSDGRVKFIVTCGITVGTERRV